eukprot:Nk52_evm23s272 gene=Nk52_evmTU23s272
MPVYESRKDNPHDPNAIDYKYACDRSTVATLLTLAFLLYNKWEETQYEPLPPFNSIAPALVEFYNRFMGHTDDFSYAVKQCKPRFKGLTAEAFISHRVLFHVQMYSAFQMCRFDLTLKYVLDPKNTSFTRYQDVRRSKITYTKFINGQHNPSDDDDEEDVEDDETKTLMRKTLCEKMRGQCKWCTYYINDESSQRNAQ